jgi:hypothetical protein
VAGERLTGGLWGSRGGSRFGVWYSQFETWFPAVVALTIEDAETFSKDSSRLAASASLPSRSIGNVAMKLETEPDVLASVVPPSEESETE